MQYIEHWQASFLVSLNSEFENCRGRKGIPKNYLEKVEKKTNWMKIENREEKAKSCIKLWETTMNSNVDQMKERTGVLEIKKEVCFTSYLFSSIKD